MAVIKRCDKCGKEYPNTNLGRVEVFNSVGSRISSADFCNTCVIEASHWVVR